jgi:hypothetical protein
MYITSANAAMHAGGGCASSARANFSASGNCPPAMSARRQKRFMSD